MKKIYLMAIAAAFTFGMTSCEDFLDSENYTEANTANYPASPGDLNKELAALYGVMNQFSTDPLQSPWFVPYLMSDDANGAGGTGDVECHAIGHLMVNKENIFDNAWHNTYVGIARANAIIYAVDAFDWTGQEKTSCSVKLTSCVASSTFVDHSSGAISPHTGHQQLLTPVLSRMQRLLSIRTFWPTLSVLPI